MLLRYVRAAIKPFLTKLDKRFKVLIAATGIFNWAFALPATYSQLYTALLGATPLVLGLLSSLGSLIGALAAIPAGWFMDKYGTKKALLCGLLLFAASALIYALAVNWLLLLPATVLLSVVPTLVFPISDIIIVETTSSGSRAKAMGMSRSVWSIFSSFSPPVATMLVVTFGGLTVEGIRPIFYVQLFAALLSAALVALALEDTGRRGSSGSNSSVSSILRGFKVVLSRGDYMIWILAVTFLRFSMSVSFSYLPLWLVEVRHADPYTIGLMNTVGLAVLVLFSTVAGALADKFGWLKVFITTRTLLYVGTIVMAFIDDPRALVFAGITGAFGFMYGAGSVSFIPFITAFWEAPEPDLRGSWLATSNLLAGLIAAVAPVVGGVLWESGYKDFTLLAPLIIDIGVILLTVKASKLKR
ncbi:MAG: MFS transporter [Thermofilaceae archaeon]|nr:MFS transporter [Thermofilaceae archaeon]MCX8180145.1 MFS transporter [Thermofilaceae archaeon]MDW8004199.1 MFS transporter [Thermofilaceae archaeon]